MSFAYMPLFTGDYRRDTQHLSMMEHGAYLLLLAHCWDEKGPIPLDERRIFGICNARSNEEMGAVRHVLAEFFTRMEDGHYNRRIMREIERSEAINGKRREAGRLGARVTNSKKRKDIPANARQMSSKRSASDEHVPLNPIPIPIPRLSPDQENRPTKATAAAPFSLPDWVPRDAWLGWEEMRRGMRKPLTNAARTVNLRRLLKFRDAGDDPRAVLDQSTGNGWAGLFAFKPDRGERKALTKAELAELFPDEDKL